MKDLTWTCHVCGDVRPDQAISVHTRDDSGELGFPGGTFKTNVRYCNDREACIEGAPHVTFFNRSERAGYAPAPPEYGTGIFAPLRRILGRSVRNSH